MTDIVADIGADASGTILRMEAIRTACVLRQAGWTWDAIATEVGYSNGSSIARAVKNYTDDIPQEAADDLRKMNVERLNYMLSRVWGDVTKGESSAIRDALAIIDKMDRLMGTEVQPDAPTLNANILVIDGDKQSYIQGLMQMAGKALPGEPPAPEVVGDGPMAVGERRKRRKPKAIEATATDEKADRPQPCKRYTRPRGADPGAPCRCGASKEDHNGRSGSS